MKKISITTGVLIFALIVALGTIFVVDHYYVGDERIERVQIGDYDMHDLTVPEAESKLLMLYEQATVEPIEIDAIGFTKIAFWYFDLDTDPPVGNLAKEMHRYTRQGTIVNRFVHWVQSWNGSHNVPIPPWIDTNTLTDILARRLSQGNFTEGDICADAPDKGMCWAAYLMRPDNQFVINALARQIEENIFLEVPEKLLLDVRPLASDVSRDGTLVPSFVRPHDALDQELVLVIPDRRPIFVEGENLEILLRALDSTEPPEFLIQALKSTNAEFYINDDHTVSIIPSQVGYELNWQRTVKNIRLALDKREREIDLVLGAKHIPSVKTEDLSDLGINHLVSRFTTYHSPGGNRVDNIQMLADIIDGYIVLPGEQFNLNTVAGERTAERGFKPAGMLFRGKLIDSVGGGISQFATTFYNTIFWGGYKDIRHTPHSLYFSRYPEGIEATVSWPDLHLIFENNDDHAILFKTSYTDSSITVSLYGDNDGRILIGDHQYGQSNINIIAEGGAESRVVEGSISKRYDFVEPHTEYVYDKNIPPYTEALDDAGIPGWKVNVFRTIRIGAEPVGEEGEERLETIILSEEDRENGGTFETWSVRYHPWPNTVKVNPCHYISETQANMNVCSEALVNLAESQ